MEKLKKISSYVLEKALSSGADQAECRVFQTQKTELTADSTGITLMRTTFSAGMSVKVIRNQKKGSASVTGLDTVQIDKAIQDAIYASETSSPDPAEGISEFFENKDFIYGSNECDRDILFEMTAEFLNSLKTLYPSVSLDSYSAVHTAVKDIYSNTNHVLFSQSFGNYCFSPMFYAKKGDKISSFAYSSFTTDHPSQPLMYCGDIREQLENCIRQLEPTAVNGKTNGCIIATPQCVVELISLALSLFAGDTAVMDGTALWKDKIGMTVVSPLLSVSSDPFDDRIVCGRRVTGDGYAAAPLNIITNGVLESFNLCRYAAAKTGLPRGKNDFDSIIVNPGATSLKDMIENVENGLLLCRISGGHPGANGDMSAVAKNSFLIKNGTITGAVSETMISMNLSEMLNSIRSVSKETLSTGSIVAPYICFDHITISGK